MNTKKDTTIKATTVIHVTLQDQNFTLSQADAYHLYYALATALGIYPHYYSGTINTPFTSQNNSGTPLPQPAFMTSEGTPIKLVANITGPK